MTLRKITMQEAIVKAGGGDSGVYMIAQIYADTTVEQLMTAEGFAVEEPEITARSEYDVTCYEPDTTNSSELLQTEASDENTRKYSKVLETEPSDEGRSEAPENAPEPQQAAVEGTKPAKKSRRQEVIDLYKRGMSLTQIADELGLTEAGVYYHLKRWQETGGNGGGW